MSFAGIRLLAIDAGLAGALADADAFERAHGAEVASHLDLVRDVVAQTQALYGRTGAEAPWLGYLAIDGGSRRVVGTCGFVGGPAADGAVEIAYFTFPEFEGRGYATLMAGALLAIARRSGDARAACAHTLRERNASCRILEKHGFAQVGEADDADAGRVWRWELAL